MAIDSGVLDVGVTPACINRIEPEPTIIEAGIRRFVFWNNEMVGPLIVTAGS